MRPLLPLMRSQAAMHAAREAWTADVCNTQISHFHLQVHLRLSVCADTPYIHGVQLHDVKHKPA